MSKKKTPDRGNYEVGYGRPPAAHRFKKGETGNPKGRPRGIRNFSTDVKEILNTPVHYEEKGNRKKVSTQRATLLRLREKALRGDPRALDRLLELALRFNGDSLNEEAGELGAADQEILDAFAARIHEKKAEPKPA